MADVIYELVGVGVDRRPRGPVIRKELRAGVKFVAPCTREKASMDKP